MEIEHINDDTIRVRVDNSDLVERGVTFLDLLGSQSQIESFFYSILEEVDIDEEFKNTDAVTFQVMPKNNGLELYISKGTQYRDELFDELDEDAFKTMQELGNESEEPQQNTKKSKDYSNYSNKSTDSYQTETPNEIVLKFNNIEQVILMSLEYKMTGIQTLYDYKGDYYLYLKFEDSDNNVDEISISHALEYGTKVKITKDVLDEYAHVIQKDNALEVFSQHFG